VKRPNVNRNCFPLALSLLAATLLSADLLPGAEPPGPEWNAVEVVAVGGFDELTVKIENGEVRQAFLVGLRPIPPELGFVPPGKEQFVDERTRIAQKVLEHLKSADLFAQVVTEQDGKLGLSIDAFSHHRHAFPHPWDPRKYPYCNTGWGAYNFNLFFLEQGYTTFLDTLGDHELADVFQRARRAIENNLSKSVVVIPAATPSQNVRILYYDNDLLFLVRDPGDDRTRSREKLPGLFVHSNAHGRWIEIHKISTRDGVFGSSHSDDPEAREKLAKVPVTWDFTEYRHKPHMEIPLRTSGSLVFPDRIEYDAPSRRYRIRFFSKLKIESAETTLYISRAEMLAAFGK
jgi:hypothetical protein